MGDKTTHTRPVMGSITDGSKARNNATETRSQITAPVPAWVYHA